MLKDYSRTLLALLAALNCEVSTTLKGRTRDENVVSMQPRAIPITSHLRLNTFPIPSSFHPHFPHHHRTPSFNPTKIPPYLSPHHSPIYACRTTKPISPLTA